MHTSIYRTRLPCMQSSNIILNIIKIRMGMLTEIEQRLDAEGTIRIGENYQATDIPISNGSISDSNSEQSHCLWDPR